MVVHHVLHMLNVGGAIVGVELHVGGAIVGVELHIVVDACMSSSSVMMKSPSSSPPLDIMNKDKCGVCVWGLTLDRLTFSPFDE